MAETQSIPFDLIRSPLARKKYNVEFDDSDFDGTANFEIVLSDDCPDNVEDCIDSTGVLKSGFSTTTLGDIKLELIEYDDYSCEVVISETVEFLVDGDIDVKGIFLQKKSNDFVVGYSIVPKAVRFCDKLVFEESNVLWKIIG